MKKIEYFIFDCRMFTETPDLIPLFKFAKNHTLKELETNQGLAMHATNVMNVVGQVNLRPSEREYRKEANTARPHPL